MRSLLPVLGLAMLCLSLPAPEAAADEGTVPPPEATANEGTAPEATANEGTAPEAAANEGTAPEAAANEGTAAGDKATEATEATEATAAASSDTTPSVTLGPAVDDGAPVSARFLLPPVMIEQRGDTRTRAFFPLYFDRRSPADSELLAGLYYQRRSPALNADVVAPLFASLRGPDRNTFVAPPLYTHRDGESYAYGLAPLFFTGRGKPSGDEGAAYHTVIPPLLTWISGDQKHARVFAGPYWRWRDGSDTRWGIFPLVWGHREEGRKNLVVPPLWFHFEDEELEQSRTIVPPLYWSRKGKERSWGLAPLLFRSSVPATKDSPGRSSLTIPPLLLHYSRDEDQSALVTPLFARFTSLEERGDATRTMLITPLYQSIRGTRSMDAVAPFFFHFEDSLMKSSAWMVPPFYWSMTDPGSSTQILFPLFGQRVRHGLSHTWATPLSYRHVDLKNDISSTWVMPNLQVKLGAQLRTVNLHPLVYYHREPDQAHTVAFPLYWHFEKKGRVRKLIGNTYYRSEREGAGRSWALHVFPLAAVGGHDGPSFSQSSRWWQVLYGLAGYERRGLRRRAQVLWIPFQLADIPTANTQLASH